MSTVLPSRSLLLPNKPWNRSLERSPRVLHVCAAAGGNLTPQERFESMLKTQRSSLDRSSEATGVTPPWTPAGEEPSEETLERVRSKLREQALISAFEEGGRVEKDEKSIVATNPSDPRFTYEERERNRLERRKSGMQEYELLKRELEKWSLGIGAMGGAYCFLVLSLQAAVSYGLGVSGSYIYLQLLYREIDQVSAENVPQIFQQKRNRQKIGFSTTSILESGEKIVEGSRKALSSQRLAIPAILMGVWAVSKKISGDAPESFHLELAPLILGFLVYKAAALVQTYRDNKDLIF